MNKTLFAAVVASTFGLGALSAFSADMTTDERSELRQRAERLQAERARAVNVRSDVKLDRQRGDVKLNQQRGEVKTTTKRTKSKKATKKTKGKRSLRDVPGALVR